MDQVRNFIDNQLSLLLQTEPETTLIHKEHYPDLEITVWCDDILAIRWTTLHFRHYETVRNFIDPETTRTERNTIRKAPCKLTTYAKWHDRALTMASICEMTSPSILDNWWVLGIKCYIEPEQRWTITMSVMTLQQWASNWTGSSVVSEGAVEKTYTIPNLSATMSHAPSWLKAAALTFLVRRLPFRDTNQH